MKSDLDPKNQDFKLEEFWITFKLNIKSILEKDDMLEITSLSNKLNELQSLKLFNQIEENIQNYIEKIGYKFLAKNDYYKAHLLDTTLKRCAKSSYYEIIVNKGIFNCLFKIYLSFNKNNNQEKEPKIQIINLIKEYSLTKNENLIKQIVLIAIEKDMYGTLDKLKFIVDLKTFVKSEDIEKFEKNFDIKTRALKYSKLLKNINI